MSVALVPVTGWMLSFHFFSVTLCLTGFSISRTETRHCFEAAEGVGAAVRPKVEVTGDGGGDSIVEGAVELAGEGRVRRVVSWMVSICRVVSPSLLKQSQKL